MKIFIYIFLFSILITNYGFSSNQLKKYNCSIKKSTNIKNISPLEMSAPTIIHIIYDPMSKSLINYYWNQKSVIKDFELISKKSSLDFIEIGRKGYTKTLSSNDLRPVPTGYIIPTLDWIYLLNASTCLASSKV